MGGSGGGGSSGAVEYPAYIMSTHGGWLGDGGVTNSVTAAINSAHSSNPFISASGYNPNTPLSEMVLLLCDFAEMCYTLENPNQVWSTMYDIVYQKIITSMVWTDPSIMAAATAITDNWTDHTASVTATPVTHTWVASTPDVQPSNIAHTWTDPTLMSAADIADATQAHADVLELERLGNKALLDAHAASTGSYLSSAFAIAVGLLSDRNLKSVGEFGANLRMQVMLQQDQLNADNQKAKNLSQIEVASKNVELLLQAHLFNAQVSAEDKRAQQTAEIDYKQSNAANSLQAGMTVAQLNADNAKGKNLTLADNAKTAASLGSQASITNAQIAAESLKFKNLTANDKQHLHGMMVSSLEVLKLKAACRQTLLNTGVETYRMHIVAFQEYANKELDIDEAAAVWRLRVFEHAGNVMASVAGGTTVGATAKTPSTAQSALAGGLSGAAAGGMIGGPWGAAIGGAVGVGAALLSR